MNAKQYSKERRKRAINWIEEDVIAEAWIAGYTTKAEFYIYEATIQGMEAKIKELEEQLERISTSS